MSSDHFEKKRFHNFADPRSTNPLYRGIGLSSRIQNSVIHAPKRRILHRDIASSQILVTRMYTSIGSRPVALFACNSLSVGRAIVLLLICGITLSTRRATPCFIACNINT